MPVPHNHLETAWFITGIVIGVVTSAACFMWYAFWQFVQQHNRLYNERQDWLERAEADFARSTSDTEQSAQPPHQATRLT